MRVRSAFLPLLAALVTHSQPSPPAPRASILVTPISGTAAPVSPYGTGDTLVFNVNNMGPGAVNLNFACEELSTVQCTNVNPSSATVQQTQTIPVTVTYNPVGETGPGKLYLEVTGDEQGWAPTRSRTPTP